MLYQQPYIYMVTALLHTLQDEVEAFYALCWIMISLGWREHFIQPFPRQQKIVGELQNCIRLSMPRLAEQLNADGEFMGKVILETLYDFVFQNIGFCGEAAGLPLEIAQRLFELVIFEGYGDESLSRVIIYMLLITEERCLQLDAPNRFRYIAHGRFITDVFSERELFASFVSLVAEDVHAIIAEERMLSVMENQGTIS